MRDGLHYFTFMREADFREGDSRGLGFCGGRMTLEDQSGIFLSSLLDSGEMGTEWHRLSLNLISSGNARLKVSVYASEKPCPDLIWSPELSPEEKLKKMEPYKRMERHGSGELLLHGIMGRYLWIALQLFQGVSEDGETAVEKLRIYFPRQTFLRYLPEVYEASDHDGFLDRFLSVFQSFYEDTDRSIEELPLLLDADTAPAGMLARLAGWIGIDTGYLWPEDKLRRLLKQGIDLYRRRGTREGILDFLRLYAGGEVWMTEKPFHLTIILRKELAPSKKVYQALLRAVREVAPAEMEITLIVLEPYLFLGGHSYLGLNSALCRYRPLVLDGNTMLPFAAVGMEEHS